MKNKKSLPADRQGGFLQIIIAIVIVLILMNYYQVSASDVLNWIKEMIQRIFS